MSSNTRLRSYLIPVMTSQLQTDPVRLCVQAHANAHAQAQVEAEVQAQSLAAQAQAHAAAQAQAEQAASRLKRVASMNASQFTRTLHPAPVCIWCRGSHPAFFVPPKVAPVYETILQQ